MAAPPVNKVAIIGINGRVGGAFAKALLKSGTHTITALTRKESAGKVPEGIKAVLVDYSDEESIVAALKGQEFLIITLSVRAPPDQHSKIVTAAAKAGVKYIMPNSYGFDVTNEGVAADLPSAQSTIARFKEVEAAGAAAFPVVCGFWIEWSLACGPEWFGFDIKNRKVIFYDGGNTKINVSTWDQCGRAVSALLALPESGASPSLADWKNKPLYFDSFLVSQRDMLDSLNRVLGTKDADWTINHETTAQRYKDGLEEFSKGQMTGFAKSMYARVFYPNGDGNYTHKGLANEVLGLPKENFDEVVKTAVEMVESGWSPFAS